MERRKTHKKAAAGKALWNRARGIYVLAIAVLLLAGGVTARYVWQGRSEYAAVTAETFYFTAELLGDSEMTEDADSHFSMEDPQRGMWHLYGGGEHKVTFNLCNFYDELRVTQDVITYSVKLDGDQIGAAITDGAGNALPNPPTLGTAPAAGGTYDRAMQELMLHIPEGYTEDKTVTVVVESSAPYKKTMELSFMVHSGEQGLSYEIVDSANSPYAELIIRNGGATKVQPTIDWSATTLSIDNTNELTFGANFAAQAGMTGKRMQISRELKPGESVSIYFFKSDSKNYTVNRTAVDTNIITITNPA